MIYIQEKMPHETAFQPVRGVWEHCPKLNDTHLVEACEKLET